MTRKLTLIAGVAGLASASLAAASESPLVLRSSVPDSAPRHIEGLNGKASIPAGDVYSALSQAEYGCSWDALILVDVHGLRPSHLPSYRSHLLSAPQTLLSIPHVAHHPSPAALKAAAEEWVKACSKEGDDGKVLVQLSGSEDLEASLKDTTAAYPSHLILLTGTRPSHSKRQLIEPTDEELSEAMEETLAEFEAELSPEMADEFKSTFAEINDELDTTASTSQDESFDAVSSTKGDYAEVTSTEDESVEELLEEWFPELASGANSTESAEPSQSDEQFEDIETSEEMIEELETSEDGENDDEDDGEYPDYPGDEDEYPEDPDEDDDEDDNSDGYYDMLDAIENGDLIVNGTNSTSGPLLEHATILSTPVITALLVSFGILVPILIGGVSALASIQVPPYMMSIAKTGVSQAKKDQ